jgi:hypothetical protein
VTPRHRQPPHGVGGLLSGARTPVALVLATIALAGCGILATGTPPPGTPGGSVGPSIDRGAAGVRSQMAAALSARNLILADAKVPYRPGEPAELASVSRTIYQVQLRDDPQGGFIVAYDLATPELAAAAGRTLAAWLSTGPGRIQAPAGTVHVLRQVGAALIYYRWLPGAIVDPDAVKIQPALETLGVGIEVPR